MFAQYLKAQLIVLLRGGLVGPIFLITFFATKDMFAQPWMLYSGLLITAADVLIALAMANKRAQLEQSGVLALAQITGMGETGMSVNDRPLISLNLHIEGPGLTPFDATDRVSVSVTRMGNFNQRKLVVLVDPATKKFQIDWQGSALVNGLMAAQFAVAEDNKTYDLSGQAGPLMEILQIYKANNLPFSGRVDLRSNPVVRQQVVAVVRRAAAQQAQAAPAAAPAPGPVAAPPPPPASPSFTAPKPSVSQRLQELETLRATGAVSEQEYQAKRAQIISQI